MKTKENKTNNLSKKELLKLKKLHQFLIDNEIEIRSDEVSINFFRYNKKEELDQWHWAKIALGKVTGGKAFFQNYYPQPKMSNYYVFGNKKFIDIYE